MSGEIADDDLVRNWEAASGNDRAPLIVAEPLTNFLDQAGLGSGEPEFQPIGDGHSNVTYLIRRNGLELILRRPPRPPLPPSAHDVLREARLIAALSSTGVPVPEVLAVDGDSEILGVPFFVMERVDGFVPAETIPESIDSPEIRTRLAEGLIDTLAEIHQVAWRERGLEDFGRPDGFLGRQVRRFGQFWQAHQTRSLPDMDRTGAWLEANLPESNDATIVHGDFRLGNLIFTEQPEPSVAAVLDWELSTIGDPLADLGYLLALWVEADDPSLGMAEQSGLTRKPGFPSRNELLARYEAASGRRVEGIGWYMVLALWKLAVIMEGNLRRAQEGDSDDGFAGSFGAGIERLAARAWELTGAQGAD